MQLINSSNFLKHEVDINPAFDAENLHKHRQDQRNSTLVTLVFYAILLLIFYLFLKLSPPFPPLSDQGVFLNIGLMDEGMGSVQPTGTASEFQAPVPEPASSSPSEDRHDVVTQETDEDIPVVQKKEEQKKPSTTSESTVKKSNKTTSETPPKPKPKALYPGNTSNSSTSEGTGNKTGDQGKPNGNPFGDSYEGNPGIGGPGKGGSGGNAQLGMSGRSIIYYPSIVDVSQKTGKVVVNIKVDKQGNVIYAKATQKGSTTTDSYLFNLAEEAAMKTRVNSDPNAAEEQFGTITYTFRVK